MNYEFPLVFFTALTQLAVGLALVATWREFQSECIGIYNAKREWLISFVCAAAGLVASLFHLGDPGRAFTALANLSQSWLSREGLVFGLFAFFALLNALKRHKMLALCASVLGVLGIIIQGLTYAPVSMPVISNAIPLCIFALSALALGMSFTQMAENGGVCKIRLASLLVLAILLVALPFIWKGGDSISQATAALWLGSMEFWAGIACLAIAVVMTFDGRAPFVMAIFALAGVVLCRMTFFADTLHTATRIGMPY